MSTTSPTISEMMKAITYSKKMSDEQQMIKSRIVKLRKEEERANKRINDMQRRKKFVQDITNYKAMKTMMLKQTNDFHKHIEA